MKNLSKKIILFFICIVILNNIYAQNRIVDLRIKIVSPIKNSYIKSPGLVSIVFSVLNKGIDNIEPNDTLRTYPITNDTSFPYKYFFFNKTIVPGDSEIFQVTLPFNSDYDQNYYLIGLTSSMAFNRSKNGLVSETLEMQKDNNPSITVRHRSAFSEINPFSNPEEFNMYPNPVDDKLNLSGQNLNAIKNYRLKDINGAILKEGSVFLINTELQIQTHEYNTGVYYLSLISERQCTNIKFIILR